MTDKKTALKNLLANLTPVLAKLDWVSCGEAGLSPYNNLLNIGINSGAMLDANDFHLHILNRYPVRTASAGAVQIRFENNGPNAFLLAIAGLAFFQGSVRNTSSDTVHYFNEDTRLLKTITRSGTTIKCYSGLAKVDEITRPLADDIAGIGSVIQDDIPGMPTLLFAWGQGEWGDEDQKVLVNAAKAFKFDLLGNTERTIVNSYAELLLEDAGEENREIMVLNDESLSDVNMVYTLFTNGTLLLQPKSYLPDVPTQGPKSFYGNRKIPDTNSLPQPYYETIFGSQLANKTDRTEWLGGMRVVAAANQYGYPAQWVQFYVANPFGFIGMAGQFLPEGMLQLLRGLQISGNGAGAGKHLQSDANGVVSWQSVLSLPDVSAEPAIPQSGAVLYCYNGNVWVALSNGTRKNLTT